MQKHHLLPVVSTELKSASTDALDIEQILMRSTTGSMKPGSTDMQQVIPEGNTFDDLIKSISMPATSYFDQMIAELCRTTTPAFTTSTTPEPEPVGNLVSTERHTDEIWLQETFKVKATPAPKPSSANLANQLLEYRRPDNRHYVAMIAAIMAHVTRYKNMPEAIIIHSSEIAAYTSAIAANEGVYAGVMHYWDEPVKILTEKEAPEPVRILLESSIIPVGTIYTAA